MEGGDPSAGKKTGGARDPGASYSILVALVAAIIFVGCITSPPSLMDDVDAVQAQIARTMLQSGDWVTARLDGIAYLEKSPLKYWMMAVCFKLFGVHDWAARLPVALAAVLLCWVTAQFGTWAFDRRAGMSAGLVLATSVGLFLFTRILIPDVILTLAITVALFAFVRALEEDEPRPSWWAVTMWACLAAGVLLKSMVALVFPVGVALLYLGLTRQLWQRRTWNRLRPVPGMALFLAIAAPWHVLATLRNPPYFDFTLHSEWGSYHGFFWFYFINEQLLRFLNRRYPRDYNTVPRLYFWLFHLLWLFPWSAYSPTLAKLRYRRVDRAARMRLLALCWTGFVLVFFTFSTTQEYYSMPCYPALALLLGAALASSATGDTRAATTAVFGTYAVGIAATGAAIAVTAILWMVRAIPTPGDIAVALQPSPDISTYTLSLGHMGDLTLRSFAYLRLPLAVAGIAFAIGAAGSWAAAYRKAIPMAALVAMMVLFFHAARLALVVFDPYMSSRPLASALESAPPGKLIVDDQYYTFSSVFFYANRSALLLNGRVNNLVYGSYAPDAPQDVFIDDREFQQLWQQKSRYYIVVEGPQVARLERLVGKPSLHTVAESGGKFLFTNL
jgi:4-amino-4-deoxy-L-arabinose transferase-like glycosyltransferase